MCTTSPYCLSPTFDDYQQGPTFDPIVRNWSKYSVVTDEGDIPENDDFVDLRTDSLSLAEVGTNLRILTVA